jgi:hypothetical protein
MPKYWKVGAALNHVRRSELSKSSASVVADAAASITFNRKELKKPSTKQTQHRLDKDLASFVVKKAREAMKQHKKKGYVLSYPLD